MCVCSGYWTGDDCVSERYLPRLGGRGRVPRSRVTAVHNQALNPHSHVHKHCLQASLLRNVIQNNDVSALFPRPFLCRVVCKPMQSPGLGVPTEPKGLPYPGPHSFRDGLPVPSGVEHTLSYPPRARLKK